MSSDPDQLHKKLALLQNGLALTGFLCHGTVLAVKKPRKTSKEPRIVYQWTRKVKQKTISVTLTKDQYQAFQAAIGEQRQLMERIRKIQNLSVKILLSEADPTQKPIPNRLN